MLEEMRNELVELIEGMDVNEQYSIFCEYCENAHYYDDRPEDTDSINELCYGMKSSEILERYSDLDMGWDYFYYNGYGNVEEWEGIESNSSIDEVVDYIIENDDSLYNDDIREILDRYEDDDDDEE